MNVGSVQVVHTYFGHGADVHLLLPFGDHVISVDRDNVVIIWDVESEGLCCIQITVNVFVAVMHKICSQNRDA